MQKAAHNAENNSKKDKLKNKGPGFRERMALYFRGRCLQGRQRPCERRRVNFSSPKAPDTALAAGGGKS